MDTLHPFSSKFDFQIIGGKTIIVEVEVIDGPLDYNVLLGILRVYAMDVVVSTYLHTITFPHKGGITFIDQLALFANS